MKIREKCVRTNEFLTKEFVLVLPKEANEYEIKAANEFDYLLKEASGFALEKVSEKDSSSYSKRIFLGLNEDCYRFDDEVTFKNLGSDGFIIKTIGSDIYIYGMDRGTLFGVYTFFEISMNYRYYAEGEMKIDKGSVPLYDFDYFYKPDIDARSFGYYDVFHTEFKNIELNEERLKIGRNNYHDWIAAGHMYFEIMPKSKYMESNPEFYSPDGANLCLTSDGLATEFSKNVFERIRGHKGRYFMIGQEDNFTFCDCERCKRKIEELGTASTIMVEFSNEVARNVRSLMKESGDNREIKLVSFAYNATSKPPINGIKTEDNLAIMYVPFGTLHNYTYLDDKNKKQRDDLFGWSKVTNSIFIWDYCANFDNFLIDFNDYHVIKDNYKLFSDLGVEFIFDQGPYNTKTPCFDELKLFLRSNLSYDTSLDYDDLFNEFMDAYYKEIAPHMKKYLKTVLDRWNYIHKAYNEEARSGGCDSSYYMLKHFWPLEYLRELESILNEARGVLETIRIDEWDKYIVLKKRLKQISISSRFIFIRLYGYLYGEELPNKINKLRADMNECGITFTGEANTTDIC